MASQGESLPPAPERPRLLVVDDDEARRVMFARIFENEGYEVQVLADGTELLDVVRQDQPDLILLDIHLPGASGFELCGDLRMMDEARQIPIVLITAAEIDEQSVVQGLLSGADDFICTPSRLAELKARVRVQLRNRRDRQLLQWAREQRATFRRDAMLDALTGIPNRRSADEALDQALGSGQPIMVMLVDVDHFKRVNDTHGHAAGDIVLKNVAQRLQRFTRHGDAVGRYGGEEFFLLIKGAPAELAPMIAERFRRGIAEMEPDNMAQVGRITASIGVATWHGTGPKPTRARILESADAALYEAKGAGRNCVSIRAVESLSTPPKFATQRKGVA